ncbi:MAG TPA: metallophosphoesterase [Longimicrobiaceae bacterium]
MTDGARPGPARDGRPGGRRRDDRRRAGIVRIAAVGDFHCGEEDAGRYRDAFARANDEADVLLLAGDLTRRGTPAEFRVVAGELSEVRIPTLAVLGNHDHESHEAETGLAILRERGGHILDGEPFELDERIGFAGVKGFIGGFGRFTLTAFGEAETKAIVTTALDEVARLEFSLRRLSTPARVVLLHYSPIADTVIGEPEQIFPFLGNDRLVEPIDRFHAAAVFHGHAHHGTFRGKTPGGVPVFNVSHVLLRKEGVGDMYYLFDVPLEEPGTTGAQAQPAPAAAAAG